jgi:hypothetical protein
MIIKSVHRRRLCLCKPLVVILILTVICVSSIPTTKLGAHCFHRYSKRLQAWGPRRSRASADISSGPAASLRLQRTPAVASYLSVRGGSAFDLPTTEVTVFGPQTSVEYCGRDYIVSMYTSEELKLDESTDPAVSRQIPPFTPSDSLKASEPASATDDADLPAFLHGLLGEWSFFFLIMPITILKLLILM